MQSKQHVLASLCFLALIVGAMAAENVTEGEEPPAEVVRVKRGKKLAIVGGAIAGAVGGAALHNALSHKHTTTTPAPAEKSGKGDDEGQSKK